MLVKSILSMVGGIVFGLVLVSGSPTRAACFGNCSDSGPTSDGCYKTFETCICTLRQPNYPDGPVEKVCSCIYSLDCGPAPEEGPVN